MDFTPKNFERMVEQDVREDIITPLLHKLGYAQGTENDIRRSHYLKLRYARNYFGRQKPSTDQPLSGYADYILDVGGQIRWVIEAKPPTAPISEADIEQAFHYARHPEIRAVCFCLCNGRELKVFRTDYSPENALMLSIPYEQFDAQFDVIANVLSPSAMRATWPEIEIDIGKPLGPNLRSIARVGGGYFKYESGAPSPPLLGDFLFTITGGSIERNEQGKLTAFVTTRSPIASAQRLAERLAIDRMDLVSDDEDVSTDPTRMTTFTSDSTFAIPAGEVILGHVFHKPFLTQLRRS